MGAAISNVVVYPLNVIVTRLQTQKKHDDSRAKFEDCEEYADILDAAYKIYQDQGIAGFYPGLAQDTCKAVADSFLFFLAYTTVRQRRIVAYFGPALAAKRKNVVLPILDELAIGVVAGAFAKLFTAPLANIVTRKQTAARRNSKGGKDLSAGEIAAQIMSENGLRGFWSGYSASLVLTLNPSITFLLNELLKYTLLPRAKRQRPSAAVTFLLAALSKSAASSITYPVSLAKTRAQATSTAPKSTESHHNALSLITPRILSAVVSIARTEGIAALYAGLSGEVLKGFFSHGFTMLAKDAVYASIVKMYYLYLIVLRRYPSPEELIERSREQAEEYSEIAREGARDLAERARESAKNVLKSQPGNVSADITSNTPTTPAVHGADASSGLKVSHISNEINETAELVGDYVEDEAAEWKTFYHWFWEKDRGHK